MPDAKNIEKKTHTYNEKLMKTVDGAWDLGSSIIWMAT